MDKVDSTLGSPEELAKRFRDFYTDVHRQVFDMAVRHVWLEQHFMFKGRRRVGRWGNGIEADSTYSHFMKKMVGISQKPITINRCFSIITTYLKDFFPEFLDHDPSKEPEYFKYPYKHVTLDHLVFVHRVHNRLELLAHAEKRKMDYVEFCNWATNQVLSYNLDIGQDVYVPSLIGRTWPFIKNNKYSRKERVGFFDFKHER